jgi:hypothetical protein
LKWTCYPAVIALLACGFSEEALSEELKRVPLNGFSLLLPGGEVTQNSRFDFAGRYELALPAPGIALLNPFDRRVVEPKLIVRWAQHGLANDEYRRFLTDGIVQSLPGPARVLRETGALERGWAALMGGDGSAIGVGSFACEPGFNVDVIVSVSRDPDAQFAMTRDIISSVRCSLTDANRRRPVAATLLPNSFLAVPDQQFATYASLDGELLNVNFTGGNITSDRDIARQVLPGMYAGLLQTDKENVRFELLDDVVTARSRFVFWKISLPEIPPLYMGMLWCPKVDLTFMPLFVSERASEARARQIIGTLGCPGDPTRQPPDARAPFKAACEKGDQYACELREEYGF